MAQPERERLAGLWRDALTRGRTIRGRVGRSPAAADAWEAFYASLDDEVFGLYGSLVARAESHVARLSLTYALLDGSNTIGLEHHRAAVAVWNYCEASIQRIWPAGETTGDPNVDRIMNALRERGPLSRTDISRLFSGHKLGFELDVLLENLVGDGRITEESIRTGGAPRTVYTISDQ